MKLRSLTIDDFSTVLKWSEDASFCSANGWEPRRSSKELYNWWLRCIHDQAEDFVRLGIVYEGGLIGYADLAGIHEHSAELGIAIGDSNLWGRGLGYVAARCIIQYGAEALAIRTFYAETDEGNVRSQKMLAKLGFKQIDRVDKELSGDSIECSIQYKLQLQNLHNKR